jgi:hypothetical protein
MDSRYGWRVVMALALFTCALPGGIAQAATFVKAKHGNGTLATAQLVSLDPDLVVRQKRPNDTLATAQPVSPTYMATDVVGSLTRHQPQAFFAFALVAGDQLHVQVSAKHPTTQFPELLLYDPNGNLVAVAAGNGSDGSTSIIDFTVPNGDGGNWTAEVAGSPNAPNPSKNFFKYDLTIQGATGTGPVIPK